MKSLMETILLITLLAALVVQAQPRRRQPPRELTSEEKSFLEQRGSCGIGVHDPSTIVKCKDTYWMFYTGVGTLLLETDGIFIGPGHPGIWKEGDQYLMGMHFYNGAQNGRSQYAIRPMIWDDEGWPVIVTPKPAS